MDLNICGTSFSFMLSFETYIHQNRHPIDESSVTPRSCLIMLPWVKVPCLTTLIHSFSHPFLIHFHTQRVAGVAALGGLEIPHDQQKFRIVLLTSDQDRAKQVRKYSVSLYYYWENPFFSTYQENTCFLLSRAVSGDHFRLLAAAAFASDATLDAGGESLAASRVNCSLPISTNHDDALPACAVFQVWYDLTGDPTKSTSVNGA